VSAQTFLYRLHELDLISDLTRDTLDTRIKDFYAANGLIEPDATRRCLTPNGRFFDLLLTAETMEDAQYEVKNIQKMVVKYRLLKI
jgi:hypothetical protein